MCWCPSEIRASATGPAFPATALLYIDPSREGLTSFFTLCVCVCVLWPVVCDGAAKTEKRIKKDDRPTPLFISFARRLWNVIITLLLFFIIHTRVYSLDISPGSVFIAPPWFFFLFKSTNFHSFEFLVKCYFFFFHFIGKCLKLTDPCNRSLWSNIFFLFWKLKVNIFLSSVCLLCWLRSW